jgi:ABC-type antimicrobial peptide transport system permease subunit
MAVAMLIALWIYDELSFNKYHQNYAGIVQVMQHQNFNGDIHTDKAIPIPLRTELGNTYGEDFKYLVLSSWTNPHTIAFKDKVLSSRGNFMEPGAPGMLTLRMLKGSRSGLTEPTSILLSQSVAKAVFDDTKPIGQTIKFDSIHLRVTGIYEDIPYNSSFHGLSFIAPWELYAADQENKNAGANWHANSYQLFAQVETDRNVSTLSEKIKDIKRRGIGEDGAKLKPEIFLQPMSRWHLYSEFKNGINTGGQIEYIWMFGMIGGFVLFLACINFMNLSTARSQKRAKEVGIRKAIGSLRIQLIKQFFTESLLVAVFAFVVSLILVQLALPFFNELADKRMTILWSSVFFWLASVGFIIFTGLIAGSYPALYLSSFKPVKVLKGAFHLGRIASMPRKALVTLQFTVSVVLIIGTIVVFRQIEFAKDRPIGYNRNGLLIIRPYSTEFHQHFAALREDLLKIGSIIEIAESGNSITRGSRTGGGFHWKGKDPNMADEFATFAVTPKYGKTIGWQLVAGRDFSEDFSTDSLGLILNEASVRYMGLTDPVGETITWGDKKYTIIGVTKNIIMRSPYDAVKPTLFYSDPGAGLLNIRIHPAVSVSKALGDIQSICKRYSPANPLDYQFVDDEYQNKFVTESRVSKLAGIFAGLAICISCLGLFGMASFLAEQRTKEIGVRKVLGASVFNVWRLLNREFAGLILVALSIATPTAYYLMNNWLQNYEYRVEISWWIFAVAGLGSMVITLLTVSYQSIKAALTNPVKSLKTE